MADQDRNYDDRELRYADSIGEDDQYEPMNYTEETAAEIAAPIRLDRRERVDENETAEGGRGIAYTAIVLSILSLFIWPVLLGAAGIVLGFIAFRRGATSLGSWAIGIGVVSLIIGVFILPFF